MFTAFFTGMLLQGALQMTPSAMPSQHFEVTAGYEPSARKGAPAAILVSFKRKDPDVNINEEPAPRLKFVDATSPLVAPKPPASSGAIPDPALAHYLDLNKPVRFPVTFAADAPKGLKTVKTSVAYFYCSKRENWCRKGTAEFDLPVLVQ